MKWFDHHRNLQEIDIHSSSTLLQWKNGIIGGVASWRGRLVVFYYLSEYEIWTDKRGTTRMLTITDYYFVFNATFSYIMATSFSGGRSRREPPTLGKQPVNFYHLRLWVECTLFCNLQIQARTHAILVIGLYELLGNPTT